jgi:hypothetical protein
LRHNVAGRKFKPSTLRGEYFAILGAAERPHKPLTECLRFTIGIPVRLDDLILANLEAHNTVTGRIDHRAPTATATALPAASISPTASTPFVSAAWSASAI